MHIHNLTDCLRWIGLMVTIGSLFFSLGVFTFYAEPLYIPGMLVSIQFTLVGIGLVLAGVGTTDYSSPHREGKKQVRIDEGSQKP